METGIYEQIINRLFQYKVELAEADGARFHIDTRPITKANATSYLSRYLYQIIEGAIACTPESVTIEQEIRLVNDIITLVRDRFNLSDLNNDLVEASGRILTAVIDKTNCDYPDFTKYISEITPTTLLSKSVLFTGSNQSVSMLSELKREIRSCDEICFLISFIRKSGLNLLMKELLYFTNSGKLLKVITTTYMGATEYEAIRDLAQLKNTEIKISYNGETDRLHAKAYLFVRNTGFHTGYIGSSNISKAALTNGLEWNIKATSVELPHIIKCVKSSFETCWEDEQFETFRLGIDDSRLKRALGDTSTEYYIDYKLLDLLKAKQYQQEILDKLTIEREVHGRWKNLIVAATGTGKTVISAFDYKRFKELHPRANLLFVAHREEIIKQAMDVFRRALQDENFGDLWYGGHEPSDYSHVFASKDTLYSRFKNGFELAENYYDFIIVDEAHHVLADSYQPIINKFRPVILLGMTATPERKDGDIRQYFCDEISAEIRLADALNNNLLAPFHYYGVTDCVDLSNVRWERGRYLESDLTKIYTANDRRTGLIFRSLEKYLGNSRLKEAHALCFCVSIEHAKYMAAKFTLAGLRAASFTSENTAEERTHFIKKLSNNVINYLFVVDVFNEGVDIPCVDAVLFLRPTESLTIYLQQLGRGLRKHEGKEYVTVIDFVGNARAEFNYTDRFRALIGKTSMSVKEELEHDFPHLPLNCTINLEEKARNYVLENIKNSINSFGVSRVRYNIQNFSNHYDVPLTLKNFVEKTQTPLNRIYNGTRTWRTLCEEAGLMEHASSAFTKQLSRAVSKKWLSTDAYSYFDFIHRMADSHFSILLSTLTEKESLMATMFYYDLFEEVGIYSSLQTMFEDLARDTAFVNELLEVILLLKDKTEAYELDVPISFNSHFPLKVHGRYTKRQIQVAIGTSTLEKKSSNREGVERNLNVEAMYVDLIKDREEGSTTNYNDIAISQNLFDWQTQSRVSQQSKTGQNYIGKIQTMLLFVREQNKDPEDNTRTMGFVYLGEVTLVDYSGNNPINIRWKLKTPMPASLWRFAGKLAIAN
nr:DUF3427 domain-containing protein [uncultured Bacteroides sp.]